MKVGQLRTVLQVIASQKKKAGDDDASTALEDFARLLAGHDKKTVVAIAKMIKAASK